LGAFDEGEADGMEVVAGVTLGVDVAVVDAGVIEDKEVTAVVDVGDMSTVDEAGLAVVDEATTLELVADCNWSVDDAVDVETAGVEDGVVDAVEMAGVDDADELATWAEE
jgi:hypothetical protein